jgi:hypothetical protein
MVHSARCFWPVLALALGGLAACGTTPGDASDGGSCPAPPATCPSPPPSWSTDVQPIVDRSCAPCHFPPAIPAQKHNFSSYAGIYSQRGSVLGAVSTGEMCRMPAAGGNVPLSLADREKLLAWLVCGAQQN